MRRLGPPCHPGGTQAHGFIALLHMHHFCNTRICVKVDFRNAFNEIERARMV
jgi:hypothetical protein